MGKPGRYVVIVLGGFVILCGILLLVKERDSIIPRKPISQTDGAMQQVDTGNSGHSTKSDSQLISLAPESEVAKVRSFLADLTQMVEKTGYYSRRFQRPPAYFFDPARFEAIQQSLRKYLDLAGLIESHILEIGSYHPAGRALLWLLDDLRKEIPGLDERLEALDRKLTEQKAQWARDHGIEPGKNPDSTHVFDVLRMESLPLGRRIYFLEACMPRDKSKPYVRLRTEDILKMASIADTGGVSAVLQAALISHAMQMPGGAAAGDIGIDALKIMIPIIGRIYTRSRAILPGVCLSILEDRSLISELRDEQEVHPPAERLPLNRDLAHMVVAELRQCVSEGKVMIPEFDATIGALDWQATLEHFDYGKHVLLSGSSVELRRAGLAFVCPASSYDKRYEQTGRSSREESAKVLTAAVSCEPDDRLRHEIALSLVDLAFRDPSIWTLLESMIESGILAPKTAASIREEMEAIRRRSKSDD